LTWTLTASTRGNETGVCLRRALRSRRARSRSGPLSRQRGSGRNLPRDSRPRWRGLCGSDAELLLALEKDRAARRVSAWPGSTPFASSRGMREPHRILRLAAGLSMFIFLSLALVKRFVELSAARQQNQTVIRPRLRPGGPRARRNPRFEQRFPGCAGPRALCQQPASDGIVPPPNLVLLICPLLLYWISRVWLTAHRGQMHDDPIVFALKDRVSYVVGFLTLIILCCHAIGLYACSLLVLPGSTIRCRRSSTPSQRAGPPLFGVRRPSGSGDGAFGRSGSLAGPGGEQR